MSQPLDVTLYDKVKAEIIKRIPKHSAYRSGLIVQEYKRQGGKYKGVKLVKEGLARWFKEDWRNQDGKIGYKKPDDVYRPTKRITSKTPTTIHELTKPQIEKAKRETNEQDG
jgi:hypothetical protein